MPATTVEQSELAANLRMIADIAEAPRETDTRDWTGFFKALSTFISAIMPFIIPLFSEKVSK
jgi:hypothetical protein